MKTTFAVILCVLLLLFSACAQKVNDPADVQAIKNLSQQCDKAEMAKDVAWYTSVFYADDATRLPPNESLITGKSAIGKALEVYYAKNTDIRQNSSADDVQVSGDLAVARGKYTYSSTPAAGGLSSANDQGKWVAAYRRQSDGTWKCFYEVWNSDQPVSGATPNGVEEEALYQLERDWAAANLKKDTAVVGKFLANDFVSNFNGRTQNKRQVMDEMGTNPAKIESGENHEMKAVVFGDMAVIHGLYVEKSTTGGKDTSQQVRWTEVYAKRDGRWQCVTQYLTKVQ
jgi:uncharacterized protein (TIGR02246 family)